MENNPYILLGTFGSPLQRDISPDEVDAAWLRSIQAVHRTYLPSNVALDQRTAENELIRRTDKNKAIDKLNEARKILTDPQARRRVDIRLDLEQNNPQSFFIFFRESIRENDDISYRLAKLRIAQFIAINDDAVWDLTAPHLISLMPRLANRDMDFFGILSHSCNNLKRKYIVDHMDGLHVEINRSLAAFHFIKGGNSELHHQLIDVHLEALFETRDTNKIFEVCLDFAKKSEAAVQMRFLTEPLLLQWGSVLTFESRFPLMKAFAESSSADVRARILDLLPIPNLSQDQHVEILTTLVENSKSQTNDEPDIQWRVLEKLPEILHSEEHWCNVIARVIENSSESRQHQIYNNGPEFYTLNTVQSIAIFNMSLYLHDRNTDFTKIRENIRSEHPALARNCDQRIQEIHDDQSIEGSPILRHR
jgi:hypothetical protein